MDCFEKSPFGQSDGDSPFSSENQVQASSNTVLALFDFDGTITRCDSYTPFLLNTTPVWRIVIGFICLFPLIVLNKLSLFPSRRLRPMLTWFATVARVEAEFTRTCEQFALGKLPSMVRPIMLERIHRHISKGHRVVVVSATVKTYLEVWCQDNDVECIASELVSRKKRLTGQYLHGDCHGNRKTDAIYRLLNVDDYEEIYAYGDTEEDFAMLALANHQFYQGKRVVSS